MEISENNSKKETQKKGVSVEYENKILLSG